MKRNILLLFGLLGLLVLEYGCKKEPLSCGGSSEMQVTGIQEVHCFMLDSNNQLAALSKDEAPYDKIVYRVVLDWERIADTHFSNYSAYANLAPYTNWKPQEIIILYNEIDVTDHFTILGYPSIADYLDESPFQVGQYLHFSMLQVPEAAGEKTFEFKILESDTTYSTKSKMLRIRL
ncbi:hypothetical protein OAD66_01310 [Bacteroidia bacterium]|nr:hypothetical protein [Bacteroidia bacterium]MDB9881753.1 hypothetical protein [Bacteroidia bacterium]